MKPQLGQKLLETSQNTHTSNYSILSVSKGAAPKTDKKFVFEQYPENVKDPIWLSNTLQMSLNEFENHYWIAANQIGFDFRVIYIRGLESAMFNPVIVDSGDELATLDEINPSFDGLICPVSRPKNIRVRSTDVFCNTETNIYTGLTARAIQSAIDALDGVPFYNRANRYHRNAALKKWNEQ